jgi:hypothetical protein
MFFCPVGTEEFIPGLNLVKPWAEIEFWQVRNPDVSEFMDVPPELIDLTIHCAHDALEILVRQIEPFALETELLPGVHSVPFSGPHTRSKWIPVSVRRVTIPGDR